MTISCTDLGKRYRKDQWVLRHFNHKWNGPGVFGIAGDNGSGKSTLLRMLIGYLSPTEGAIRYLNQSNEEVKREDVYKRIQVAAPYDGLIDFMTVEELYDFHFSLRQLRAQWNREKFWSMIDYQRFRGKKISELSSGMQQRLRLLFACATQCDLLILDEPSSYLDIEGKGWWKAMLSDLKSSNELLCFIASNEPQDLEECETVLRVNP